MKKIISILTLFFVIHAAHSQEHGIQFIENKGQWNESIRYKAPLSFGDMYFTNNSIAFVLLEVPDHEDKKETFNCHHFNMVFKNANAKPFISYSDVKPHYYNYFIGEDSSKWKGNVPVYGSLTYRNIYNGIDLNFTSIADNFKYEYNVAPHANPNEIWQEYEGLESLKIRDGNLVYTTSVCSITELKPYAYQMINGRKKEVPCEFVLTSDGKAVQYRFPKGYNHNIALTIDPTLIFARLTGSTSDNFGFTATYDQQGRAYAGGIVFGSSGLYQTTPGSFDVSFNGGSFDPNLNYNQSIDIGISCYHPTTGALIYGTYVGGSSNELPNSMIVDNDGNLLVLGTTGSNNFPMKNNSFDGQFSAGNNINLTTNGVYFPNGSDIVVFKLDAQGSNLLAATYMGGSGNDGLNEDLSFQTDYDGSDLNFNYGDPFRGEIIVDDQNNIYVASSTNSSNFPTQGVGSSLQGAQDAVVFKLNSALSSLLFSRYLGGNDDDAGYSMKIDGNNNLFVDGGTKSANFPVTGGSLHSSFLGGFSDGFLCKLNNQTGAIIAGTFLGTSNYDQAYFIDLDKNDFVYVVGQTLGSYPTENAIASVSNGRQFIHKLSNDLSTTIYSTKFGTGGTKVDISPTAFLVDNCERVYVSGWGGETNQGRNPSYTNTNISGLTTTTDALDNATDGSDFYFFVLDKNASGLLYASYFGGSANEHVDGGTSRFDNRGVIYQAICAACNSGTFPSTTGFSQNSSSFNCNEGIVKLDIELPLTQVDVDAQPKTVGCIPLTVNFESVLQDVTSFEWDLGDGTTSNAPNPVHTYTDTGHYTIRLIGHDPNSCNEYDTAYVSVWARNDTVEVAKIDTFYFDCNTYDVYVGAPFSPTATYNWDMGDGTIYADAGNFVNHQYPDGGIFQVVLEIEDTSKCNGYAYDTLLIDFPPFVEANIGTNAGCINTPLTMVNFSNPIAETFIWDLGNGLTSFEYQPYTSYPDGGEYTVYLTVIDSGTCNVIAYDTNVISIIPPPHANFVTDSNYYVYPAPVQFYNWSYNYDTLYWTFGDGETESIITEPLHYYQSVFDFTPCLKVFNDGCADSICKPIFIDFIPLIGVPNAFSPNGDGENDIAYVKGVGITQLNFKIYNRWGELVFESFDQADGWDGTFKGIPQEMEVYTYVVNATLLDGSHPNLKGNLTLLR